MYYVPHGNLLTQTTKENKHRPDAARNVGCAWRTRKLDTELDEAPWQHQGRPFPGHPAAAYKASPQNRMERKTGVEMKHATPSEVRQAFLKMVYESTRSLSLTRECKDLFDKKAMPEVDRVLRLS